MRSRKSNRLNQHSAPLHFRTNLFIRRSERFVLSPSVFLLFPVVLRPTGNTPHTHTHAYRARTSTCLRTLCLTRMANAAQKRRRGNSQSGDRRTPRASKPFASPFREGRKKPTCCASVFGPLIMRKTTILPIATISSYQLHYREHMRH